MFHLKERRVVPDGDDVREKHDESEEVAEPRTHKPLQRDHDNGQNHLGQEQGLGEAVQLQVQQADLWGREVRGQSKKMLQSKSPTSSKLFRDFRFIL